MALHNNRLARLAQERRERSKCVDTDNEPTVEDRLSRLEEDIRRLKIEYDIYFNGGSKRRLTTRRCVLKAISNVWATTER